jgi:hypothetical protein
MADKENVSSQILSPAPSSLPRLRVRNEIRERRETFITELGEGRMKYVIQEYARQGDGKK